MFCLKEYENSDLEDEPADISVDVSHYSCTVIRVSGLTGVPSLLLPAQDAAWQRIRQVQDDIDSQDSSNVRLPQPLPRVTVVILSVPIPFQLEITNIDDVSELSSIKEVMMSFLGGEGLGDLLPCLLFQKEFEPKSPKEQSSGSKTAPALPVATSKSDEGWQQKAGKGKFRIGKKKKSPSTGDIAMASQEPPAEGLKKGKTKGKKASKSKKKSASKDSDHREAVSPVVLEDYDGGEEPRRVGGARVAAMSREDMPQLRQLALARKEGEARAKLCLKARAIIQGTAPQGC